MWHKVMQLSETWPELCATVPACKNCYGELCHNVKQSPVDDDGENVLLEDDLITDDSLEFDSPWYEEMIVKG